MKTTTIRPDVIDDLTLAEAAAWLTRQSEKRPDTEAAFKEWLAASPSHRRAFERVSDVWDILPGAADASVATPHRHLHQSQSVRRRHSFKRTRIVLPACAALVLVAMTFAWAWLPTAHDGRRIYTTAVGAQKTVVLADNTRITLDSNSRIVVRYTKNQRHVWLKHGQALFQVKHNTARPFVLRAGHQKIVDLGTIFDVSHYASTVAVTLLEGKVWIGNRNAVAGSPIHSTVLKPGQRLVVRTNGTKTLDQPDVDDVMAWQHGRMILIDSTLAQALIKINRHNRMPIHLADKSLGALHVSGVFATRVPSQFAQAIARLYGLHVHKTDDAIVLAR